MDIEQLKLVLETVSNVSGDAQSVAIWWLVLDKVLPCVTWLISGTGLYFLILKIARLISMESKMLEIKRTLEINKYNFIDEDDVNKIIDRIKDLKSK